MRLGLRFDRLEPGFVDAYTGDPRIRAQVPTSRRRPRSSCGTRPASLLARARRRGPAGRPDRLPPRPAHRAGVHRPEDERGAGRLRRRGVRATSRSTSPSATRPPTRRRTPSSTPCCRAAGRWPSGTPRTGAGRSARRTGSRPRCTRCPAPCATGSAASTGCRRSRRSGTRWSPTSRGRASTTTRATTARGWRSTPTCRTGSPSCRTWSRTSPTPVTTPSTAARSAGSSSAPAGSSTPSSSSTPPSASWPRGWPTSAWRRRSARAGGRGRRRSSATSGLRFDGHLAERIAAAAAPLNRVRQDAAILLHDRGADADEVARLPAAVVAGQPPTAPPADPLPHRSAVARLHLDLRRGLRPAGAVAGRPAGGPAGRRPLPPAARRAADPGRRRRRARGRPGVMSRRDPRQARVLGLWTAGWLAVFLVVGMVWLGDRRCSGRCSPCRCCGRWSRCVPAVRPRDDGWDGSRYGDEGRRGRRLLAAGGTAGRWVPHRHRRAARRAAALASDRGTAGTAGTAGTPSGERWVPRRGGARLCRYPVLTSAVERPGLALAVHGRPGWC